MKAIATLDSEQLADLEHRVAAAKASKATDSISDRIARRMKIGGGKVIDAPSRLPIRITKNDVRRGALKNASACAAAQAICRVGGFREARVHTSRTYVKKKNGDWLRYLTPPALSKEIVAFDRGGSFEPGDYELIPVQPSERIGARAKRKNYAKPHIARKPTGKPRPYHLTTGIRSKFLPD